MRFRVTDRAKRDLARLPPEQRRRFAQAARMFSDACDRRTADPNTAWPKALRVRSVEGAPGVFEMTWSYSGPDGRATWEWGGTEDGRPVVVWRRVGDHRVFTEP